MLKFLTFLAALSLSAFADNARIWQQDRYEDFDKGTATNVSLRSDGQLLLAPKFRAYGDPQLNYIWALAEDSRGRLYAAGGSPGKIVRITKDAKDPDAAPKLETIFTSKELEVHALAFDEKDNLFAATSPDPKIYKISPDGQSTVFYEPRAKYVWAIAWDPAGFLYIATGDQGQVFRVDRDGKGALFFDSQDTHVRSLALEGKGGSRNLIVGTDPSGLILRVTPKPDGTGTGFVLYQAGKKEITSLAVADDGSIYAAAVGDKPPRGTAPPAAPPVPIPTPGAIVPQSVWLPGAPIVPPTVTGGTEIYRLMPDGSPRRLWLSRDDVVYALAFSAAGKPLLGSGNKGKLFQLDSDTLYTTLVKITSTQITALYRNPKGLVYAGAGNVGKVYEMGSEYEKEGHFESEIFDTRNFARWGRVHWKTNSPPGTTTSISTRSGNVDNPDRNWSPWSRAYTNAAGEITESPGARFLQWKVAFTKASGNSTPMLDLVEIAYLPKNLAPVVDEIEATPGGYRFNIIVLPQNQPAQPLNLLPLGQPRPLTPVSTPRFEAPAQLMPQKGAQGARWAAHDDNDDQLVYALYIRGVNETAWKVLKERITDKFYSWDANTLPDGRYVVKVVASDSPSNSESEALTDEKISQPFDIDNTPPAIQNLQARRESPRVRVTFRAVDAISIIKKAEFSVDGGDWQFVLPADQIADSLQEEFSFLTAELAPGEHTIAVRVYDKVDNVSVEKVVVK